MSGDKREKIGKTLDEVKADLMKDPKFKAEYEKYDLAFEVSKAVIELRMQKGITQEELAKRLGTKQSAIARLENCSGLPSLSFLQRIAEVSNMQLIAPKFVNLKESTL